MSSLGRSARGNERQSRRKAGTARACRLREVSREDDTADIDVPDEIRGQKGAVGVDPGRSKPAILIETPHSRLKVTSGRFGEAVRYVLRRAGGDCCDGTTNASVVTGLRRREIITGARNSRNDWVICHAVGSNEGEWGGRIGVGRFVAHLQSLGGICGPTVQTIGGGARRDPSALRLARDHVEELHRDGAADSARGRRRGRRGAGR